MRGPEQMEFVESSGVREIGIGLVLIAVGAGSVIAVRSGAVRTDSSPGQIALVVGGFVAIGLCLVLHRKGVTFDRQRNAVVTWWGVLVPFRRRMRPLKGFEYVSVERVVERSNRRTQTIYPVCLEGRGRAPLLVRRTGGPDAARQVAERVAKFLRLEVRDSSGGRLVLRRPDELDATIRSRLRKRRSKVLWPTPPDGCRIEMQVEGDTLRLEFPRLGLHWFPAIVVVAGVVFICGVGAGLYLLLNAWGDEMPIPVVVFFVGIALALLWPPLKWCVYTGIVWMTLCEQVEASPRGLTIVQRCPFWRRRYEFPAHELEEFELPRSAAKARGGALKELAGDPILVRSDNAACRIGDALRNDELWWVHAAIESVLADRRPQL